MIGFPFNYLPKAIICHKLYENVDKRRRRVAFDDENIAFQACFVDFHHMGCIITLWGELA